MAKGFSATDAKRLMRDADDISSDLSRIQNLPDVYRRKIKEAADKLVAAEVLKILKDIPIDELNRDKKGIKVKTLRDAGYNSLADIATATTFQISSVHGISQDKAFTIRRIVDDIVDSARESTKIRISVDSKTERSNTLITAISIYNQILPLATESKLLYSENYKYIADASEDIKPRAGFFSWLFTSSGKKKTAEEAFNNLKNKLNGEFGSRALNLKTKAIYSESITTEDAWIDFQNNSVKFFTILEDIAPGVLGTDDEKYGLPEDIAREVQDEAFFPDGLLCDLRRYQELGVKYILHQGNVLLGDEMGLGKTIQAIATMVSLKNTGATHFVVVCPASVVENWCREIRAKSKLSVTKIHGIGKQQALNSWTKTGGVAVTTYETTSCFTLDDDFRFTLLVVDEAHYIKNTNTNRSKNVIKLSTHAERELFMTGTALENKVDEMVTLINLLQPSVARSIHGMEHLAVAPQFRKLVAPVYYRRKRENVLTELPDKIESKEWCSLLPLEEKIYESAVLNRQYADARRVSWSVDELANSSKARRMLELINEAQNDGRKVIIFSFFLDTIYKIAEFLGDRCLNPITGSVSPQRRQEIIDEFNTAPAGSVLIAQIQSGGTGLNIQSASVVIICEPQFKPSIENQAISRAYRMGQTRNVLVYRLLCENTIDERITELLETKQKIFDAFADKSEAAAESINIDNSGFGDIIQEEIDRINAKYSNENNSNST